MSDNIKEQIEDYLRDQLNQKEREIFEKALANDEALQKELSFKKLTIMGAKQSGKVDLKDRLKQIHREYENENQGEKEPKSVRLWPKWIGIAASVMLLITAGFFFLDKNELNSQVAFEEYYQAAPLRLATRDLDTEKTILQLNEFYNAKEFEKALPIFQKLLAIDSTNSRIQLGAGICHLELNLLKEARDHFSYIIKKQDFRLQHQANWYMALSYLKEENLNKVQKHLAPIINDSKADHYQDAVEIMERLND